MTAKKTDSEKLKAARKVIEERGREIKTLETRVSTLQSMNKLFTGVQVRAEHMRVWADGMKVQNEFLMEQDVARKKEIATLKDELRESGEEVAFQKGLADDISKLNRRRDREIQEMEDNLRRIRRELIRTWENNDLLREQLVGSHLMPNGRPFRDRVRGDFLKASFKYVSAKRLPEDTTNTTG